MSWPAWHLEGEPLALVKYVLPDEVGRHLRLPGPSDESALVRLSKVYLALLEAGIEYSHEPAAVHPDWQRIRPPAAVLRRPGHGTCLDVAVTMAGACKVAGLHPMIVIVEADEPHALVLVRLEDSPLDEGPGWWTGSIADATSLVATSLHGPPRPLVAVDPVGFTQAPLGGNDPRFSCDLAAAVARGGAMLIERPGRLGVDVGRVWLASEVHDPQSALDDNVTVRPGPRWVYRGGQGRRHFNHRAQGRQTPAWRRKMFVGRKEAVDRVLEHCQAADDPAVPLIITGPPGSGKSSVLGRVVITLEESERRGVAVHGRDAPLGDIVAAVAEACGLRATTEPELIEQLDESPVDGLIVAVDALDEMRTNRDRSDAAHLLCELAALDGIRVLVATRSRASERPNERTWKRSDLVRELCAGSPDEELVVDLDSDRYFSSADLTELIELILRTGGRTAAESRPGAHTAYAADPQLLSAAAKAVESRADRNYLMACLIAAFMAGLREPIDPRTPSFDESMLPATIGDTLRRVLDSLPSEEAARAQALLTALAYGRGSGLTDIRWVQFAHALGHASVTEEHIQQLRTSSVADYLFETIRKDGRSHTRLFHRALAEHLRSQDNRTWDESRLCDLLRRQVDEGGWTDGYVQRFLPSHVLAAGRCEEFLDLPEFLVHCYPSAVGPVAYAVPISSGTKPAAVFRLALPYLSDGAPDNAETLEMAARTQGAVELGDQIAALAEHPLADLLCVEALPSEVPGNVFIQHVGTVNDVCALEPARVVTVSDDGTARMWDPYDRESPQQAIFARHEGPVWAVVTLPWPGIGGPAVVTVSQDGTARVWDPYDTDVPQLAIFEGHEGPVRGVATLPWPGVDRPVVVTTSDDRTARVWNPHDPGCPELARFTGHTHEVLGVATLARTGRDEPLVVTTSEDATCRVWDPYASGCPEVARFDGHTSGEEFWTRGLTTAAWPGLDDPVVITSGGDSTARVWRPVGQTTEELLVYSGHRTRIRNVFLLPWDDAGPAFATCGDDGTVRLWRPDGSGGVQALGTYDAHPGNVSAGVFLHPEGRPPAVVSCSEGGAHVWNPQELMSSRPSVRGGHESQVRSAVLLDNALLVTSSTDRTARVWKVRDGRAVEQGTFTRHTDWVRHISVLPWPGRQQVVATASGDGTVRIWDPLEPARPELVRFAEHGEPVRTVEPVHMPGVPVTLLLSAGADNTVRLWNPYGRTPVQYAVLRHPDTVRCAILLPTEDGHPVVVAATGNEVHVWDLELDDVPAEPTRIFRGHRAWVRDLETISTPDGPRICSVGNDRTLRIWDPFGPDDEHDCGMGHGAWIWGVTSAQRPDGPLVITTSNDGSVRFWRHTPGEGTGVTQAGRLQLLTAGWSIRCQQERFVITTGRGFVLYRLASNKDPVNVGAPRARSAPPGETSPNPRSAAIAADPTGRQRPAQLRADSG